MNYGVNAQADAQSARRWPSWVSGTFSRLGYCGALAMPEISTGHPTNLEIEMKHPHPQAENMRLYAEDAAETDKPWERWEYNFNFVWRTCIVHPNWDNYTLYRRKPQPIKRPYVKIGARWVPEPMKVAPKDEAHYFVAHPDNLYHFTWGGDSYDFGWLKSNTCHLTREAAEAHLAALQELHAQSATLLTDEEARK